MNESTRGAEDPIERPEIDLSLSRVRARSFGAQHGDEAGEDRDQARIVAIQRPVRTDGPVPHASLLVPALASLALFAWLRALHPTSAGRVYAAYGGVYVGVAILWLWLVDGDRPTSWDWSAPQLPSPAWLSSCSVPDPLEQ